MNGQGAGHPLVSIIIATYRRADDLDRCLRSVLAEPGDSFEVVVGDDGSPDHTPDVVASHRHDARVRDYRNASNLGMQENYRKIARFARGDYLFILTDDDYLLPGSLAKVKRAVESHPECGYILSHLTTVDERSGEVVNLHRTYSEDRLILPGLPSVAHCARSAWVLSRQVWKRELIDWEAWDRFKDNIFFPIIVAGRLMLVAPSCYIADNLVVHTWFNKVYWEAFGVNDLEIEFSLAADRYRCMRAILFDRADEGAARRAIREWEAASFKTYLYLPHLGFYDLARKTGFRPVLRRLVEAQPPDRPERWELLLFPFKIPVVRAWARAKSMLRNLPPPIFRRLKALRG